MTTEFMKASGKDFSTRARGQVKNNRDVLSRSSAVLARQQIPFEQFHPCPVAAGLAEGLNSGHFARGSGKASQIAKAEIQ